MSREQIVRDTAYAIWEAEGKPEGRDAEHWKQAEARVSASLKNGELKTNGGLKAKPPAKGKITTALTRDPAATPPAKIAATKAGPTKKA
ncbi:DUF2934 domain-containing protein [Bosea lathyri]|uniref:DUF2934 domain-containing protein n=1 Tax=Bosea lathyri TaxID=1036778 RepID=A0A1H5XIZ2_9HYPH|nr:DUF2934 domain-containing protein [Bosea lathyri]SEG11593.1 Protein of unknown function [Bosea lathyri]